MKKLLALLLSAVMIFSLVACGGGESGGNTDVKPGSSTPADNKKLVSQVIDLSAFGKDSDGEPYKWTVIDVDTENKKALLLMDGYMDTAYMFTDDEVHTWENCQVREWLNFQPNMDVMFIAREQNFILLTDVKNPANPETGVSSGKDTKDKLFLLSVQEMEKYFENPQDRVVYDIDGNPVAQYLRTAGGQENYFAITKPDDSGEIDYYGSYGYTEALAIRPAMWVDISSAIQSGTQSGDKQDSQSQPDKPTGNSGTTAGNQGGRSTTVSIGSTSVENYKEVVKQAFGIDIQTTDGWTITKATSPNGVNNVDLMFTVPADIDSKAEIEKYFNQTLKLGGVWQQNINWDTFAISKGTQYTDYEVFYSEEVTEFMELYQAMWLYDFGGKTVQFSYTQDENVLQMSFTYTVLNYEIDINDFVPQEGQGPKDWIWQDCHGYIDYVWDSEVLPANFPQEISGVRVSETRYYGFGCDDRWAGAKVCNMGFDSWDFEQWQLTFDATEDQLAQFERALADNGFLGEKTEDKYQGTYVETTDGEIYLYYTLDESDRDGYDWNVYCNMTVLESNYPLFFEGIELPTWGLFRGEPNDKLVYAYDEDFNEIYDFEYDFENGRFIDEAAYVYYSFDYMGVDRATYDYYIDYLRGQAHEEWKEYVYSEEDNSYVAYFKLNDKCWIGCYHNFDGEINSMTLIISPDSESLFW